MIKRLNAVFVPDFDGEKRPIAWYHALQHCPITGKLPVF
jgi:hypothetical protein